MSPPGFEPGTKGLKVRAGCIPKMPRAIISRVSALSMCPQAPASVPVLLHRLLQERLTMWYTCSKIRIGGWGLRSGPWPISLPSARQDDQTPAQVLS